MVKLVIAKYLNYNNYNFLGFKESNSVSPAWKHILDRKKLLKKGVAWLLGNGECISFWYENWCEKSPIIQHINDGTDYNVDHQAN